METPKDNLPRLRPYPTQYVTPWTMPDGTVIDIRPIRPEDEPMMIKFHRTLSEQSVYFRYFHLITLNSRIAHERLTHICFIDYDRDMVLVAEFKHPSDGETEILAVGRLSKLYGLNQAEFALVVSDVYQGRGLGTEILKRLIQIGKDKQLDRIQAEILGENRAMQRVCEKVGFHLKRWPDLVRAEILL